MAGMSRPVFGVNVGANKKMTESKSIFFDIKPDTTVRLRILPPTTEGGAIFTKVSNHFKLKNPEGGGMALACLREHGAEGESCYLCQLLEFLKRSKDKTDVKIGKDLYANPRWYVQAYIAEKGEDGKLAYRGPVLVGLSKTTADSLNEILNLQQASDDDFFCDPDKGQDIMISRTGSGMNTKYKVMPTGQKSSLDDIMPGWSDPGSGKLIVDVLAALELKIEDADGQRKAALRSYPDEIDWSVVNEAIPM